MSYGISVSKTFEKDVKKLSSEARENALRVIGEIQNDPHSFKQLTGSLRGLCSARFGDYRIVYVVEEKTKSVILLKVRQRERVYEV